MKEPLKLMAIFAHPDDEAFGTGGSLTKYTEEGAEVHLVTATLGEMGRIANPKIELDAPITVLREQELRCAGHQYGLHAIHLLGYTDGQMATVPLGVAVFKLVKLLREVQPQVVITFGPEGIYGHFDHLVIHRWVTAAVRLAHQAEKWAEAGPAYQVAKLYYRVLPQAQVDHMFELVGYDFVDMDGVPFPFVGYSAEQITTVVDVREHVAAKLAGLRCYVSQLAPDMPYMQNSFDPLEDGYFCEESFILAAHNVAEGWTPPTPEDDLFAGLR